MGVTSQRAKFDAIRKIDASTFNGSWQEVGSALTHNPRFIVIQNDTNQTVQFTDNLETDEAMELIASERVVFDLTTNRIDEDNSFSFSIGTQFYVKASAGAGSFKISMVYGDEP